MSPGMIIAIVFVGFIGLALSISLIVMFIRLCLKVDSIHDKLTVKAQLDRLNALLASHIIDDKTYDEKWATAYKQLK